MASYRFNCPLTKLANVGELESIYAVKSHTGCAMVGRVRTLKVCHECFRTAVESIDDHLAVCGASNFDTSVFETGCGGCAVPCWFGTNVGCLWWKVELCAGIET